MAAITTLRTTLANAISDDTKWQTMAFPRAVLLANSVTVMPDDPYITPSNNQHATIAPLANFTLLLAVPLLDNQGNLAGIEDMIVGVFNKLATSNLSYNISTISAPAQLESESGTLLTCEMQVSILTTWS